MPDEPPDANPVVFSVEDLVPGSMDLCIVVCGCCSFIVEDFTSEATLGARCIIKLDRRPCSMPQMLMTCWTYCGHMAWFLETALTSEYAMTHQLTRQTNTTTTKPRA